MIINFLEADVPLTKTFRQTKNGALEKDAYPLVARVTSHEEHVDTITQLFKVIRFHADLGHCLLKGLLSRPLVNESRRGTTRTDDHTQWVCLDFDRHEAADIDEVLTKMGLGDVSYVLQYSASHGLDQHMGTISAHVFMLLDKAMPAPTLKAWLMGLNFKHLDDGVKLNRSMVVLSYPLDITTCQNDKLLYIAAPHFTKPLKDPLQERITLVPKANSALPHTRIGETHIAALKADERKKLNELRKARGLPARTAKTSFVGSIEVENKPDRAEVTEIKDCGDFVRLNLNHGDSWAYWHPKDNFELIHDFKSDTWYKTKELVPGYYQTLVEARRIKSATPNEEGDLILAFSDRRTGEYYRGTWNPGTKTLELFRAKDKSQLADWLMSFGLTPPDFTETWDICFDPLSEWIVNADRHEINTFRTSPYFNVTPNPNGKFPAIEKVVCHLLGVKNTKDELYEHFINWLAVVFQRKDKPLTAWVVHGVEGCLAAETEISFRRGKRASGRNLSIKEAYEKFNGIWSNKGHHKGKGWDQSITTYAHSVRDDFTIGYHEVYRIVESGVKMLYRVVTNDGGVIRVTHEHPFMRKDGSMTKLCDLKVGDIVLKRGEKNQHVLFAKGRNKQRKTVHSIQHHPHAWQHVINGKNYKRSHKARLVWEAAMNGLTFEQFINILRHHPERAATLTYLSPDIIVHHLDEDCTNDALENLTTIDKLNHDQHHAKETGLGTVLTREAKIISITEDREEMTYDMTMKAPYHNYVANDFCVSNTGKGTLFGRILQPLLGNTNVFAARIDNLEESFNGWMQGKLLVLVDEVDVDDFREKGRVSSKLRNYITEPMVSFRHMRQAAVFDKNYASFIFASNRKQPAYIPESDRRYNCGNYQKKRLVYPGDEALANELEDFAAYLLAHKADVSKANSIMQTEARERIQKLGITSIEETCTSIKNGDFDALWLSMPDEKLMAETGIKNTHTDNAQAYCMLMRKIRDEALVTPKTCISRDEMLIMLQYNVGNMPQTPNKFTSLLRHNGIETIQLRRNGMKTMGMYVEWKISDELRAELSTTPARLRRAK